MATIIADNIITPLGLTSEENYQAIKSGITALRHYAPSAAIPFGYTASMLSEQQRQAIMIDGYTRFESLAIRSINAALASADIHGVDRTVLIISSTKGNVEDLTLDTNPEHIESLGASADRIAKAVGIYTTPIVVCNACISGVSAIILADRLVEAGDYDHAVVCGVDLQNQFIISGFQSLKALSESECRPFDIERLGLNLGEGAATIVLSGTPSGAADWHIHKGAVRNDAYHITNPSPIGAGAHNAITCVLDGVDAESLAQINAHGTATMYNDQMESKAISRAGLSDVPTNALKGYIGHTMGSAGVMETIITMHALSDGVVIGTKGFDEIGVSGRVSVSSANLPTTKTDFLKIISGFGGCNAAVHLSKGAAKHVGLTKPDFTVTHRVKITPNSAMVDGISLDIQESGLKLLTAIYKTKINDYPKYYKMDPLARLGFVGAELLLSAEGDPQYQDTDHRAIMFFNSSASAHADREYLKTIADADNFYPSPSLFVYTLPNIVTGEIAIRNKCLGETGFYVLPSKDADMMDQIIRSAFLDPATTSIVTGWVEYKDENNFECDIFIADKLN